MSSVAERIPRRPPRRATRMLCALLATTLIAACGHTDPFQSGGTTLDDPYEHTEPVRLTYNRGDDGDVAWAADGAQLVYAYVDQADTVGCIARLPASGGSRRAVRCAGPARGEQTALTLPAISPDGRLAYLDVRRSRQTSRLTSATIRAAPGLDAPATVLRPAGSQDYTIAGSLRWLDAQRLVYVGESSASVAPDSVTPPVSAIVGLHVATLDATPGSGPTNVPGIDRPTSVAPTADGGALFFTRAGDSRVYRMTLADGTVSIAHDFGALGVARDVDVVGTRLVAVVGGKLHVIDDLHLGPVHLADDGGDLWLVDLATGTERRLGVRMPGALATAELVYFRRPRLAPDGARLAVEATPFIVRDLTITLKDTVAAGSPDVWVFGQP